MKHHTLRLIIAATATVTAYDVRADTAQVVTPSPVIFLMDNLDEADNLGWCIDTVGRGLSDRLHAHSCKPRGGDVQFAFDAISGQIESATFSGKCMTLSEAGANLGLLDCTGASNQQFRYNNSAMTIHPSSASGQCLTVGAASRSAGPYMSRDLMFANCDADSAPYQQWVIRD